VAFGNELLQDETLVFAQLHFVLMEALVQVVLQKFLSHQNEVYSLTITSKTGRRCVSFVL
jgi:hypothetical protein